MNDAAPHAPGGGSVALPDPTADASRSVPEANGLATRLHLEWVQKQPRAVLVLEALLIVCVVGACDYLTGAELSFSIFYLTAVTFATWYLGRSWGVTLSLVSASVWWLNDSSETVYSSTAIGIWNACVRLGFFLIVTSAIASIRASIARERRLNRIDSLTGIANGRAFYEAAQREIDRAHRHASPLTVAYIDCDNFKFVNDTLGHQTGDDLLQAAGAVMAHAVRRTDLVARLGGDEFAVLLPDTDVKGATELFERLQTSLLERMQAEDWPVTFSIGVAAFDIPPVSTHELVRQADAIMYEVKREGKNTVRIEHIRTTGG